MRTIKPESTPSAELYGFLTGAIAPRPIAFVSTVNEKGVANLAPYSFFNMFSSAPPILVFSSNRRTRDNNTKDTLHNVQSTRETVINMVSWPIVRQMALTSVEFPPEVSEFEKSGLTPLPSEVVKPFRVKESLVQLECKVNDIITLGHEGGAGHLIINEIVRIHVDESILDKHGKILPHKIDLMGRLGRAYYVRASGEAVHTIIQRSDQMVIGFDQLPESARNSTVLTGNDLGRLAGIMEIPTETAIAGLRVNPEIIKLLEADNPLKALHKKAQEALKEDDRKLAAELVWLGEAL